MKTGHIADFHHSPERHNKCMRILDQVKEVMPDLDLLTNSGENFHNPYNIQSALNSLLSKWEEITTIGPVATINATQGKHEKEGMVELLSRSGVVVMKPGNQYMLSKSGRIVIEDNNYSAVLPRLAMFPVPHAHKANLLKKGMTGEEANAHVNKAMAKLCQQYGAMSAQHPDVPSLAVGHGVVKGKNTRELKALSESSIYSTEAELSAIGADFYAWGHYHNPVDFEIIRGGYLGSFAWDFNETGYKPAMTIIDWDTMEVTRHPFDINERKKYVMNPGDILPVMMKQDVWLVNNGTDFTAEDCKKMGADFVKVTSEIEVENKIRSTEVIEAVTYQDKFKAVYPDATDEQLTICEQFWNEDKADGKIPEKKVISPMSVEVHGSKAFLERLGKETVSFSVENLDYCTTMLSGPGGYGKSSLFDYLSPFSVLFLQSNSLISTFELGDSYIRQSFKVNDTVYEIEKLFKPTLKNPKAEYFAWEIVDGQRKAIPGLTGNKQPYDEWCLSVFGSPRKYASSVLNTQFDDNQSKFMGQSINPSLIQATNVELKALFHELAGTDMKHLEMKCKKEMDTYREKAEEEEIKKAGVAENIPDKTLTMIATKELENTLYREESTMDSYKSREALMVDAVARMEAVEKENALIESAIVTLESQVTAEEENKEVFEKELSELGNVDIEDINRRLSVMDTEKAIYDKRLTELPAIQERNKEKRDNYETSVTEYNAAMSSIRTHNAEVDRITGEVNHATSMKSSILNRRDSIIRQAESDTVKKNDENARNFTSEQERLKTEIETLTNRIEDGKKYIDSVKPCPKCGYMDESAIAEKEKYEKGVERLKAEKETAENTLSNLKAPEPVTIEPDLSEIDKEIVEVDAKINVQIPERKEEPAAPVMDTLEDETIPSFDLESYNRYKEHIAGYSEDKATEIRTKITESSKRIATIKEQISVKALSKQAVDNTCREELSDVRDEIRKQEERITSIKHDISVNKTRVNDIDKMLESLSEYDKRIEEYREREEFWSDMKKKWGPNGVPARILEHTGPYVDALANELLAKYYPVYKVHSETTRPSADGKKELEVFSINVVNQETGRIKPLNCISGEERNFVVLALRNAFGKINKQNSLEEWTVSYEDEPDAHVSSDFIHAFWDMVEETTAGKKGICIAHSNEIKTRSGSQIDIREV
ncbi:MAG: hypothetical protein PQJ59_16645 [Spirochaetales bacterium]|nr:hypothetical protein [Spirochaetales bacterium]